MDALILLSGGADSAVALYKYARELGSDNISALHFIYGQRHSIESHYAEQLCDLVKCPISKIDLSQAFQWSNSSLIHWTDDKPNRWAVEMRNLVFLSIAASVAEQIGAHAIVISAHASDREYPDCSPGFINFLQKAVHIASSGRVAIEAPFMRMQKHEIIELGMALGVPFEKTWTCYNPIEGAPCGHCAACLERARAFGV